MSDPRSPARPEDVVREALEWLRLIAEGEITFGSEDQDFAVALLAEREERERPSMLGDIRALLLPELASPPGASTKLLVEILLAAWKELHAEREEREQALRGLLEAATDARRELQLHSTLADSTVYNALIDAIHAARAVLAGGVRSADAGSGGDTA